MRTLKEVNDERQKIIYGAINKILKGTEKGKSYTAQQLSNLCEGAIPTKNLEDSFARGFKVQEDFKEGKRRTSYYALYGVTKAFRFEKDYRWVIETVTDKETGVVIHTSERPIAVYYAVRKDGY